MRVRAVQAAVCGLAKQVAHESGCEPACGLLSLIDRRDVRAVLIFDSAWYGSVPAEFACRSRKPAFLAGPIGQWTAGCRELASLSAETGTVLVPDFELRYTPAACRLKELIATSLGRPELLSVDVACSAVDSNSSEPGAALTADDAALTSLDWVCHLIGTAPASVFGERSPDGTVQTTIAFRQSAAGGPPARARIALRSDGAAESAWSAEIRCREGIARLTGGSHLEWEAGGEHRVESLTAERSGIEVLLDHFSRRVVGGLIPVPTLDELARAVALAEAAAASLQSDREIELS
jgi:predicted dehydrogenase